MIHGFGLSAGTAPEVVRACAREAEALGYGSFWLNHPGPTDGLAALAHAARETARIALGVGVVPLDTRGPSSIVAGVRAHGLPLDRLLVGVGSPNPGALARVRVGIAALRERLPVRLVVAALGPAMCRLAGEVADAVLFNWLTPAHARVSADLVRAGAARAGRPAPRLLAYVRLALGCDAAERLRAEGARYAAEPSYAAHFTRMGAEPVETAIAAASPDDVSRALEPWRAAIDEIVLRALPAGDTVEEHLPLVRAGRP